MMDHFRRDGLRFEVRDSGTGDAGTAVLLHGFPQDAGAYDGVVPALVAGGLRVLVPDQRGYSPGARPEGRAAYAMPELVADVLALLDEARVGSAHVVGHDWGGAVAWALAGRHAEHVTTLTALSTPHPAALQAALRTSTQGLRSLYMGLFQLPWLPEAVVLGGDGAVLRAMLTRSGLDDARARAYTARMREPGALTAALNWYRGIPHSGGSGPGRVPVPTTLVSGTRDPVFTAASIHATQRFVSADFRLHELDAGHWLPETRPDDVAAAVLNRVGSGPG